MKKHYYIIGMMILLVSLAGCTKTTLSSTENNIIDLDDDPDKVTVYFFWGDGCPHCATQKPFLEELEKKYSEVEVKMFETWKNPQNVELFQKVAQSYGMRAQGVPTTFIGDKYWVGFAEYMSKEMETQIKYCVENDCINPGDKLN